MKRILSLLTITTVAVSMLSCGGNEKKPVPVSKELPIAVQLYSVRGDLENDFYGTLKAVKEMGYDGVEFAGLYGNSPEQISKWCEELGLVPVSAHVPLNEMLADMDKVLADYKTIGCEYIAIPWVDANRHPDGPDFGSTLYEIKDLGKKATAASVTLLYHNHDFEFKLFHNNGRKHPEPGLDFMYSFIPAEELQTELDLCWVKYAGYDPAEYLLKYSGRSPVVHFKDYFAEGEQEGNPYELIGDESTKVDQKAERKFEFRPLGHGLQDVASLLKAAEQAGSKWIVIEQDQPSMDKTPMECIKISIDYLKKLQSEN